MELRKRVGMLTMVMAIRAKVMHNDRSPLPYFTWGG